MTFEPWERELLDELRGKTCRCGRPKKKLQTFCRDCYFALPASIRKALYRDFWNGYQEARIAAGHFFGEDRLKRFEVDPEFEEVLAGWEAK